MELRPYQQDCIATIEAQPPGSYLVQMATGLGKTVTFANLPRHGERMLILSHREELVEQPRKYFDCTYGVERAGSHADGEEVVSASVQSLVRRLERFSPHDFGLIICDEATADIAGKFQVEDCEIVLYDRMIQTPIDDGALDRIYRRAIDTDPIYIVFTSGSTGIPKGVAACHRSVIDYIEQLSEALHFNEDTVFGNQTPLYFDACLKELYPTLKFGATTYLIPRNLFSIPTALVEYLNQHKINTVCWVVSALTMISAFGTFELVKPKYLHTVAFGSEVFPIKQFRLWRQALPEATFTNLYGPTEGTGMCCYYRVEREFQDGEAIPVGHPFPNREILLLTEEGKPAPEGQEGEICIRGTALTLGYYNDPVRTSEAFVQNPLNTAYPEVIYKTGDIGRYNEAGELVFVSRKDYQIKHMGHRIELGEVEVNVGMLPGIRMTACIYDAKRVKIVLYYVGDLSEKELTEALKGKLPRYMLPNKLIRLEQMPFTANGKIDRVTLKNQYEKKG